MMQRVEHEPCRRVAIAGVLVTCLVFAACDDAVVGPIAGEPVYEMLTASVDAGVVTVEGVASNPGTQAIRYDLLAPCTATLRMYSADGGVARWDQLDWHNTQPGGCKRTAYSRTLSAGESIAVGASAEVDDILGDSLPEATYAAALVIWRSAPTPGPLELQAEQVVLQRSTP